MAFATNVARAKGRAHDVRRRLFLRKRASGEAIKLQIYGPSGVIGEVERGWHLGMTEQIEVKTGERYFPLKVALVDDPDGELLQALKAMTKVKIGSTDFTPISKPSFLNAVQAYTFKVQPKGQS